MNNRVSPIRSNTFNAIF